MKELKGACIIGQSGGPTSVINASAYGAIKTALENECITNVYGACNGIKGVLDDHLIDMGKEDPDELAYMKYTPSSALGSCRYKLKDPDVDDTDYKRILEIFKKYDVRYFFYNGGNDSMDTCNKISKFMLKNGYECRVMGIPKTIDNDIWGTDITFGFNTAVNIATESIDRLHSTASSHKRVMVVEVMGHHAGWIALYAGMAGGADVILLPELGYDIDKVNEAILDRARRGKPYSIVVVAEGIETPDKKRPSDYITRAIEAGTGIETRDTVLGYTQRGGNPSPFDRNLATRLGGHATELIANGEFGRMVCMKGDRVESIPLLEVAGKLKLVTPDHDLIVQGKRMGVTFGK